jgi:hypothetical protein
MPLMAETTSDAAINKPGEIGVQSPPAGGSAGRSALTRVLPAAGHGSSAMIRSAELGLALLALAAGSYVLLSTVRMVVDCWIVVPYWDQWNNLALDFGQFYWHNIRLDLPHWLFQQHNEHRIAFPRLIFLVDRFLFAMDNRFNFFCNLAIQATLAALLIRIAIRAAGQRTAEKLWIGGGVLALLFSAMQWENLLWGFQVTYLGVSLAAVATFATVVHGRRSIARLVAVIMLETVAVYTLASGMVVPFLAVPLAIWAGWPRRHVIVLILAAFALLASYLYGYQTSPYNDDPARSIEDLRGLLTYVLREIGNPFGLILSEMHLRQPLNGAQLCGAVGIVAVVAFTIDMLRRRERGGPVPILIATALFGVGMVLLTALGRLKFGLPLSSRYSSPVLMLWASLILIATIRLRQSPAPVRVAGLTAMLPVLLAPACYQPSFVALGRAWTLPRLEATTALLAKVDDPEALVRSYPTPEIPKQEAALLHEHHLSIFAEEWSDWLGTPLADHVRLSDPARCRGGIDGVEAVGMPDPTGWRANGWAWDAERRAVPKRVVIANAAGRVMGYALSGFPKAGSSVFGAWRGHFAASAPAGIIAYALLDDGETACPVGSSP